MINILKNHSQIINDFSFFRMVGAEMDTIKDEDILDSLKQTSMSAIYRAKAQY